MKKDNELPSPVHNMPNQDVTYPMHASQFFIGPDFLESKEGWKRVELSQKLRLSAHPELSVSRIVNGDLSLTLIGFMLDPDSPTATDEQILHNLLLHFSSIRTLIAATDRLGGRWILIGENKNQRWLFHDALGLRQVFYTEPAVAGALCAMSQSGLAQDVLGLAVDDEAKDYMESHVFRSNLEYRWPGTASAFRGLKHLLPNHALDFDTGAVERYWPDKPLASLDPQSAVEEIAHLIQGLVAAGAARFDLALSLTAGLDSRLVLAAARHVKDHLTYVTVRQAKMPDNHADIEVPARLLRSLGLPHQVIRAELAMSPEFAYAFKSSAFLSHDHYGADAEAIFRTFGRKKVALVGSGGEIGRCYTRVSRLRVWITSLEKTLARFEIGAVQKFAVHHYRKWLEDIGDTHNVSVLDLFEWEQGHGNWVAMTELEFDIAWQDIYTPYNCRAALATMLSVNAKYRKGPKYRLFYMLIRKLWPEVLAEPVNPHRKFSHIQRIKLLRLAVFIRVHWLEAIILAATGSATTAILLID
jgi:hypothetical protein